MKKLHILGLIFCLYFIACTNKKSAESTENTELQQEITTLETENRK